MRLDLFVKLKYESSTTISFVGIRYSMLTYFLTSITLPDPQISECVRYGKWCQRFLWHQLALASCEFYVEAIFQMEMYVKKFFYLHIFSFFLAFKRDFIRCVDFTRTAASNTASDGVTN